MNILKAVFTFYMSDTNPVVSSISECGSQSNITGKLWVSFILFQGEMGMQEKTVPMCRLK